MEIKCPSFRIKWSEVENKYKMPVTVKYCWRPGSPFPWWLKLSSALPFISIWVLSQITFNTKQHNAWLIPTDPMHPSSPLRSCLSL